MSMSSGAKGYAPEVLIKPIPSATPETAAAGENPERRKYLRLWGEVPEYRAISPGEELAMKFIQHIRPKTGERCIDFGCGTGRGSMSLAFVAGLKMTMIDFASNCLDPEVAQALETQKEYLQFVEADLTAASLPIEPAPYGYCCDVLEHIPEESVDKVLQNVFANADRVFFSVDTEQDNCGSHIDETLHVTLKPVAWWLDKMKALGALIHWSEVRDGAFLCTASKWKDVAEYLQGGKINQPEEVVEQQTLNNIRSGWKHAQPYEKQDRELIILAGGPSLNDYVEDIRQLRASGAALVTTNGTYQWALEHDLQPSLHIVLDSREFNARFARPVIPNCLYFMASQVHPKTLEGLPHDRTFLWHSGVSEAAEALVREQTGYFFPIPGGSTVILRAIPLLRMLGFWRMHIFGFDSCLRHSDKAHHAYPQEENDEDAVFPISAGGKVFWCHAWMVSQASEFRDLVRSLGDEVELNVVGPGLISQVITTGAELQELADAAEVQAS